MTAPVADPLSAWLAVTRRWRVVLPVWLTMATVTALLLLVITPTNSFRETTLANTRALEAFTAVTPAARPGFDESLQALLDANPAADRKIAVRVGWLRYPMLIGEALCPLVLVSADEVGYIFERAGQTLVAGRLPRRDRAEVVVHEDVARAKDLELGDRTGTLMDRGDVDRRQFEVVGIMSGAGRLAVGTLGTGLPAAFLSARLPPYALMFAPPERKAESDAYLHGAVVDGGPAFRVIDQAYVQARSEEALRNLPVLVLLLTVATAATVALVVALLNLIAFRAREDEFAALQALGHRPARLARRLGAETTLVGASAWVVGAVLGVAGLTLYDRLGLDPRGIVMRVFDLWPVGLSLAVPAIAVGVSVLVLLGRMRTLDPVSIIERKFG